jgi:hypothetical protein
MESGMKIKQHLYFDLKKRNSWGIIHFRKNLIE